MYMGVAIIQGLVDFFVALAEIVLGLRVIFRLFAANPDSPFVHWIYQTSTTFMAPFRGIFPSEVLRPGGYTLDISALFAMLMYAIIGYLVLSLLAWLPAQQPRGYRLAKR